jgi:tetratricopeptide (TPR) repeat protein
MTSKTLFLSVVCAAAIAAPLPAADCNVDAAVALYEARQNAEARKLLEPCASDARAALYLGRIALAERDEDAGLSWLEKAAAADPKSAETQLWLGRAYGQRAMGAGMFKAMSLAGKAKKAFLKASELDPANLDARLSLIDFYLVAPGVAGGSMEKAREQAVEIRARDAFMGHRAFARIAEHEKEYAKAAEEYARAAAAFPDRKEVYYWRATLAFRQKEMDKAFDQLEALLKAHPSEKAALFHIGRTADLSGQRLARGEECLRLYLQHQPKREEPSLSAAHYRLGGIQEKKGSRDLAKAEYQAALRLDPKMKEAKEALERVSKS